jgi:hypothetical protein
MGNEIIMLSFETSEFFLVLEQYNQDVWPLQVVAFFLALAAILFSVKSTKWSTRLVLIVLAFFWLWNGIVFCMLYWASGYIYAYFFVLTSTVQGVFFIQQSIHPTFNFTFKGGAQSIIGLIFIVYAIMGYQILGIALDHVYPRFFPVGLVPCPTTIFTLGLFLLADGKLPKYLLILPVIGALSGLIPVSGGIYEDIGLMIAGITTPLLILLKQQKAKRSLIDSDYTSN